MSENAYEWEREEWRDARDASHIGTRLIGGVEYDEDDVPSRSDLAYDAELDREAR